MKLRFIFHEKERRVWEPKGSNFKKISKFSQSLIQSVTVGTKENLPHKTGDRLFKICLNCNDSHVIVTGRKCIGKHGEP